MSQPIEARLRITADGMQAASEIKKVQSAAEGLKSTGVRQAGQDLEKAAAGAEAAATKAQRGVKKTADEATQALRQTTNQIRAVTTQVPDIVQQLASGQSPFQVLLQQGGQIVQVTGGVGNALKALGSVFTATRLLVGGVATALGTVAVQAVQGAIESDNLRKSLALTGNAAGRTVGELNRSVESIAATQKVSIASVRESLQAVVETGKFVGPSIDSALRAATALSKLTGTSAAAAVKEFATLTAGVTAGAIKLNQAYNFLNADQVQFVRGLEAQGRVQEAMRFTLDELAKTMEQRSIPSIYSYERAWTGVKKVISDVLDSMKGLMRDETVDDRISKLEARLKRLQLLGNRFGSNPLRDAEIADVQSKLGSERGARDSAVERTAADAAKAQEEQDKILRQTKSFQDLLASVEQAGSQKSLAILLAGLEDRKSAIERANAQGLLTEEQYAASLSQIEVRRLKSQEALLRRQIEIERGRKDEKVGDAEIRQARVTALEAQLVEVGSRIRQAQQKALTDADARELVRSRESAEQWAQLWQRAAEQVSQFAHEVTSTQARLLSDPIARAEAEAKSATAAIRKQVDDLRRDLQLRIETSKDPGQRAELERELKGLGDFAGKAIGDRMQAEVFAALRRIAEEVRAAGALRETNIQSRVGSGEITSEEGERELAALRKEQLPDLERIVALMKEKATTADERGQVKALEEEVRLQKESLGLLAQSFKANAVSGINTALNDIFTGAKTGKEALLDMVGSFSKAMLDVLNKRLAKRLVDQFDAAFADAGGGGFFAAAGNFITSLFHSGGVVGSSSGMARSVNPAVFALAPRYHGGGVAGLMPGEVPLIAQVGETIRTREQERALQKRLGGIGDVSIAVQVNGANGTEGELRSGGAELAGSLRPAIEAVVEQWTIKQMRPGGLFTTGR